VVETPFGLRSKSFRKGLGEHPFSKGWPQRFTIMATTDDNWLQRRENRQRRHEARRPSALERAREELLREWHGDYAGRQEIMAHQPGAAAIGDVLTEVMRDVLPAGSGLLWQIQAAWPELVGPEIAKHAFPVSVWNRRLEVAVPEAPWRYVLESAHKKTIIERIKTLTAGQVCDVRLRAGAAPAPAPPPA